MKIKSRIVHGGTYENGVIERFDGLPEIIYLSASSRVDAFIEIHKRYSEQGDVTVISHVQGKSHPLGFTSEDLESIDASGAKVVLGTPKSGIQIETIEVIEE